MTNGHRPPALCSGLQVTKDKPPCLVDGSFSVEGKTRGYPAIYDYYRGMGESFKFPRDDRP